MAPRGSFRDFAPPAAGAASFLHVLCGRIAVACAPPSPANLAAWHRGGRGTTAFLGAFLEGGRRASLSAGDALFVPCGRLVAEAAEADACAHRGLFWLAGGGPG